MAKNTTTAFRSFFETEALVRAEKAEMLRNTLPENADKRDQDRVKTQITHANYDMKLASLSDAAVKYALKHIGETKAREIEKQSRELKKRTAAILEAAGAGCLIQDRALDAVIQYIVAKNAVKLTTRDIQREAQHKTPTQAGYMKTAFGFLGIASQITKIGKGVWELKLDRENPILKDLLAVHS